MFSFVVLSVLLSLASAQTICEKWMVGKPASITNQTQLVTAVVVGVFTEIIKDADTIKLFNGAVPCMSRDFVNNPTNQGVLVNTLVAYFGVALGCKEAGYPAYTGSTNMEEVHKNMPINKKMFDQFITSLVNTVKASLNATAVPTLDADITAVGGVLNDDNNGKICNQADCTNPTKSSKYVAKVCATTVASAGTNATTTGKGASGTSSASSLTAGMAIVALIASALML